MSPQVCMLCAALWCSLSSEGVPLQCGLQMWGLLREVCVVLCSGRGHDTVSLVTRGNSVFVTANRVLKRGQSENDVVLRKTLCCEAQPHLPDKKDKAGRKRVMCLSWLHKQALSPVKRWVEPHSFWRHPRRGETHPPGIIMCRLMRAHLHNLSLCHHWRRWLAQLKS